MPAGYDIHEVIADNRCLSGGGTTRTILSTPFCVFESWPVNTGRAARTETSSTYPVLLAVAVRPRYGGSWYQWHVGRCWVTNDGDGPNAVLMHPPACVSPPALTRRNRHTSFGRPRFGSGIVCFARQLLGRGRSTRSWIYCGGGRGWSARNQMGSY